MKNCLIRVKGRVQGVSYRFSAKEAADRLEVKGWVKNELAGSVLIEAEAPNTSLATFIQWCHQGPIHAKVTQVEVTEQTELKHFTSFEIKF